MSDLIRLTVKRNERYKTIYLEAVEDPRLSWRAKGLHTYLISRPPEWKIRYKDLEGRSTDGKTALASAIKELQDAGYLKIDKLQDKNGRFTGSKWTITESASGLPIDNSPHPDFPDTGSPGTDSPDTGNRGISNKQVSNKEHLSNKKNTRSDKPTGSKRRQTKFPGEWYKRALDAYQEIKGITLSGPEFSPLQQTLKSIYMAGHTPDEVIGLMRELEASPLEWTQNWTLRTVRMKLPEWKAGKLRLSPNGNGHDEDRIRALKEDIAQIDHYIEYRLDARLAKLGWKQDLTVEEEEEKERLIRIREEKLEERKGLIRKLKETR